MGLCKGLVLGVRSQCQGVPPVDIINQYGTYLGFAIVCYVVLGPYLNLSGMLSGVMSLLARLRPSGTAVPAVASVDNAKDFEALERLQARFERNRCKEGLAAVDVCLTHFFHREE